MHSEGCAYIKQKGLIGISLKANRRRRRFNPFFGHALMAPWGIIVTTCMLVNYEGHFSWQIVHIWNTWLDFKALSEMRDWGIVLYGAFASLMEGGRLMVFFANAYIEAKRQENQDQQDSLLATMLMDMNDNISYEKALEKVRNSRRRYEAGLLEDASRKSG